uniref:Uncharacterized protein n=1 Tax=Cacopsylla melanoneura TaxID=428564 RepID=A0A8D9FH13_9HEMI
MRNWPRRSLLPQIQLLSTLVRRETWSLWETPLTQLLPPLILPKGVLRKTGTRKSTWMMLNRNISLHRFPCKLFSIFPFPQIIYFLTKIERKNYIIIYIYFVL